MVVTPLPEFQFQYGAIEGTVTRMATSRATRFQFQYGAIEGLNPQLGIEV